MFRGIAIGLLAAAATVACADTHPVTSGGYYCNVESGDPCREHSGQGDCQPCPRSSVQAPDANSH